MKKPRMDEPEFKPDFSKPPASTPVKPSFPEDWPGKVKDLEWQLKYPDKNDSIPTDWPKRKPLETITKKIELPSKNTAVYSIDPKLLPKKAAVKNYDYPK
jgi:hypothetical protein